MSTQENWYARAGAAPHYQGQIADESKGRTIAITYDDKDGENAQLIAAAPELLRTLTNLINATNVNADELDPLTVFVAIEQAKGAIAKATGDV